MLCLTDNGNGSYSVSDPQPTDINSCVYVIAQPIEVQPAIWALTVEQGTQLAIAILSLWAVAWIWHAASQALDTWSSNNHEGD